MWFASLTFGQPAPNQSSFAGIHYQTVVRNSEGLPMQNTAITLLLTIRANAPDGEAVYSETHTATTNPFGLVNLAIGQGTPVTGEFHAINWGVAPHFLETALDATGSGQFQIMGVTQFLSVPYALNSLNGMPAGNNPGDMLYWDGSQWLQIGAGQNGQVLTFSNGIPTWGGVQLPILITTAVSNITAFTAYSGGNIASDGGSPVVGRGICWNTSPNPTTSNFKVFAGSGAGSFLAQMTGLESSTQYFVRAFATNSAGTSYGQEMTFYTTAGNITLSTTAITDITTSTATSGGNIILNGGSPVTARGVCWNTTAYPTTAHNKTTDGSGNGTFVSQLTGLTNNTTYYVRAYATNSLGTSYGNQVTFTTLSGTVTLTTTEVTEITDNSATCGGEITGDGGSPVTTRGVCWNTSPNPSTANSLTTDGEGTGIFVSTLTGLLEDTTYYVRAYATNVFGTFYGNEVSFATPVWECGFPITDSRDGQIYNTVQIGEQCWMAENLNVGTRIDGSQNQQNNGTIEKYCYDNLETNCDVFGGLYQWDEMMGYTKKEGTQGICPPNGGWIIPSHLEFTKLTTFLGGESVAGGKMKEEGTTNWAYPNTGATNTSGFTGLPGGYRQSDGTIVNMAITALLFSSTENSLTNAWLCLLSYNQAAASNQYINMDNGLSIRCLKGENAPNQPPNSPSNPTPEYGSTNISINPTLSWSCSDPDGDPITYDVFFGTENQPAQVATAIADTFYNPGTLYYDTTYYWKIVAHDDHGNSTEGEIWSFTTRSEEWQCGDVLFDERDGQEYNTVQIGEQCWMKENMNIGIRIDASNDQTNNGSIEKYCYNNDSANCDIYGGLYQWDEMMQYSIIEGTVGICLPNGGWHLPTDAEWITLINHVGGLDIAGGEMKETGTNHWASPNTGATNNSGFTALPGGGRTTTSGGSTINLSIYGYWWWSSQYNDYVDYFWGLYYNSAQLDLSLTSKSAGFSVRCLKDFSVPSNEPPTTPNSPLPESGSTNQPLNTALSWSCSDPESDPLTYDVFFGTENPPTQMATAIADTFYLPGTLNYNTTYYWKIVAHDDHGNNTEGEVWSFTTRSEEWQCGDVLIDERDAKEYNTVQIGEQCWMAENLNVGTRIDGSQNQQNNGSIEKYCYDNLETNCDVFGGLYQWDEIMEYSTVQGIQGICPEGWHLPSDEEWTILTTFTSNQSSCQCNSNMNFIGKALAAGTKWRTNNNICAIGNNLAANNTTGFSGLPSGYSITNGVFYYIEEYLYWWSSTQHLSFAHHRGLIYVEATVNSYYSSKSYGFSVRCLMD